MKKVKFLLFVICTLLTANIWQMNAQTTSSFEGKWDVSVKGTPNGDADFVLSLEQQDGTLSGVIMMGEKTVKLTKVDDRGNSILVYFPAEGYDVYLHLEKTDEHNLKGSLMDMFTATGKRQGAS